MRNSNKGNALFLVIGVLGIIALPIIWAVVSYVSAYNYGNVAEKGIVAAYENNRNVLSNYTLKVTEAAQVPAMMRDDLSKVIEGALQARYGEDGSKAVFQMLQEQNPTIDPSLYVTIQQIIAAGRDEFQLNQTALLDKRRQYETNLGYLVRGFWLGVAGYPKIDLAKYDIIVDGGVADKFKTKTDSAIKLR